MGQGNFLRGVFARFIKKGHSPSVAFANLYGCDIDATAVDNARAFFVERGVDPEVAQSHLVCADAIRGIPDWANTFNVVIGNPPYVRSPKNIPMTYELRANLVDVFFEVGMNLLVDGGNLVYITQDSFFTNEDSALRQYLLKHNIRVAESRYDYSKVFRRHGVAVDICLVNVQKATTQSAMVSVWRHQPFEVKSTQLTTRDKWMFYPERVTNLNSKLQLFSDSVVNWVSIKKGRLENAVGGVPTSYGSGTYSKTPTSKFSVPVIGEPNLDYFFPLTPFEYKNFTSYTRPPTNELYTPFIALPYFTSKFRFCLIEDDVLTTPLVYAFTSGNDIRWLLPLLNSSVTDFQIRYNTKSRDTGYEFKKVTFGYIRFPPINDNTKKQLTNLTELVRSRQVSLSECDDWVCDNVYNLPAEDMSIIQECQTYWFKKHVQSVKVVPTP